MTKTTASHPLVKPIIAAELPPEIPMDNPRDSWPDWTDDDRWFTTDDAAGDLAPEPTPGEHAVADVLAWLADDEGNDPGDYRPGWQGDQFEPFAPTIEEAAWWVGFNLGVEDEPANPPAHFTARERFNFVCGRLSGWQLSEAGQRWIADAERLRAEPNEDDRIEMRSFARLSGHEG